MYLINFYSYSVIDFKVSFFTPGLFHFLHYITLDFHLQFFASFFFVQISSNCLFWNDEG